MNNIKTIYCFFGLFFYVVAIILGVIASCITKQAVVIIPIVYLAFLSFFKAKEFYKILTASYGKSNSNNK